MRVAWLIILPLVLDGVQATLYRQTLEGYENAVCNDGTSAVYYRSSTGDTGANYLIYLQGGGYCHTVDLCHARCQLPGSTACTTRDDLTKGNSGILSNNPLENPAFHDYYKAELHYCTSDMYIGDRRASVDSGGYHFRGNATVTAMVESLVERTSIWNAANVVLTGSSAGGAGTIFNCEYVRSLLPEVENFWCIPDAAFFYPDIPYFVEGCEGPNEVVHTGSELWGADWFHFDTHSWWNDIQENLFIGSAMYETFGFGLYCGDITNEEHVDQWTEGILIQIEKLLSERPETGMWMPSCFGHSMLTDLEWYHGMRAGMPDLTYAETLTNWVNGAGPTQIWDQCPTPPLCNLECPRPSYKIP